MAHDDSSAPDVAAAWRGLVDDLQRAGVALDAHTASLDPRERADAYRALVRGLHNQLGRFEVDRDHPELVFFNGWRQKMFMDNPDFRYWVTDVRDDRSYRITGTSGDAAFVSITAYRSDGPLGATATARTDSDTMAVDEDGRFSVVLGPEEPGDGSHWLRLEPDTTSVWVRHFHRNVTTDALGDCSITPLAPAMPTPYVDPDRLARHLSRLGRTMASFPSVFDHATRHDLAHPNEVRHWEEMAAGAAFTEPGISYLRGSWRLEPGQALVIDGVPPASRYWSVLLYSRSLNSLDHRRRVVSHTDATATLRDGRYRFVLADRPHDGPGDWLDTEGRGFGIFVFRFLHAETEPTLPSVAVHPIGVAGQRDELGETVDEDAEQR